MQNAGMRSAILAFALILPLRALCDTIAARDTACTDVMVAQLVQAKLPDDIVAQKIDECEPNFQLDPAHLIALKQAGVSDALIRIMAARQSGERGHTVVRASGGPESSALPDEVGVYWIPSGTPLQRTEGVAISNDRTGSTLASKLTLHIKRERINAQLKNQHAVVQIPSHQPTFYLYLPEGASIGDYLLLKLAQRSDVRQIEVAEKTFWKEQRGVDHSMEFDVTYSRVKSRMYTVTPKTELSSGEYGFYVASGVELTKADGRIYDFGIE
jgi:hypothetical protein